PGSIRPQEPVQLAAIDAQIEFGHRFDVAVPLGQPAREQGGVGHASSGSTFARASGRARPLTLPAWSPRSSTSADAIGPRYGKNGVTSGGTSETRTAPIRPKPRPKVRTSEIPANS